MKIKKYHNKLYLVPFDLIIFKNIYYSLLWVHFIRLLIILKKVNIYVLNCQSFCKIDIDASIYYYNTYYNI